MITTSIVPQAVVSQLFQIAANVMQEKGKIQLGLFLYAAKHGRKYKYGALLDRVRPHLVFATDQQLVELYEDILWNFDLYFAGMTCGLDGWRLDIGYTASRADDALDYDQRFEKRVRDLKQARHPDAVTTTRGTILPGTTWYRPTPEAFERAMLLRAA